MSASRRDFLKGAGVAVPGIALAPLALGAALPTARQGPKYGLVGYGRNAFAVGEDGKPHLVLLQGNEVLAQHLHVVDGATGLAIDRVKWLDDRDDMICIYNEDYRAYREIHAKRIEINGVAALAKVWF